jgi:two-component system chemotaxis response regulator CheY
MSLIKKEGCFQEERIMLNEKPMAGIKPEGIPYRVLIIDDSVFIAKQLSKILTSEGFDMADTALDGIQGVTMYKALYPNIDLVTLDITMPRLDGVSALEQILEFDKQAKVIMVSALGSEDLVKKCIVMGAKNYIVKPLDRSKVLERVIAVLKQ